MEVVEKMILCPICHNKTRTKLCKDTELKNFPLFCPKCKNEIYRRAKGAYQTLL